MVWLLLGLIGVAAFVYRLYVRIGTLERELRALQGHVDEAGSDRALEPRAPARVVRATPEPPAEATPASPAETPERAQWAAARRDLPVSESPATPVAATDPDPPGHRDVGGLFEQWVAGRLLVWVGGIALAVAGLFLIRHSIDIGLVTPPVRMMIAAGFGLVLIAAGELARGRPAAAGNGKTEDSAGVDPRLAQSLVGAGVLVLYAAAYGSQILYGLISAGTAFALMAAITVAALILSLRHGAPTAVMGLAGGFATPLLVGSDSAGSVPLLTYLALLNVALFAIAARRGWTWLAASGVVLSFAWTALLLTLPASHALPAGLFILALSVAASLIRAGEGWQLDFLRPAAIGLVQLALLVARLDLGLSAWGLFGALSVAAFFLATRKPEYRILPAIAVALALVLLLVKAVDAADPTLPALAAAMTLIFAGGAMPAALRGRDRLIPVATACAGFAGPALVLRIVRPDFADRPLWGLIFAGLALGPLALAWSRRVVAAEEGRDPPLLVAAASACLLLAAAAVDLLPEELLGSAWLAIGLGAALAARRLDDRSLSGLALAVIVVGAAWAAAMLPVLWATIAAAIAGDPALVTDLPPIGRAMLVLLPAASILLAAWRLLASGPGAGRIAFGAAALFGAAAGYVLFKQILGLSSTADFVARGLAERTLLNQLLFFAGWAACAFPVPGLDERTRWRVGVLFTSLAAARLAWFDIGLHNPLLVDQAVGAMPLLNLVLPAFLLSAFWLYRARRAADHQARSLSWFGLAMVSLVFGMMLIVRQLFHGTILTAPAIGEAESYVYSLAGLLLSIALIVGAIRLRDKALRLAGLILLSATIVKVFVLDAAALEGVLRILSFLGLGVAVLGINKLYGAVLRAEAKAHARQEAPLIA